MDVYVRTYPTLASLTDSSTGAPIGWGAISGLAADPTAQHTLSGE